MLYSWQVQILYCYSVFHSFDTSGIGLLGKEIWHTMETEEDNPDPNAPSWFVSSPLDNGHLERLLAKVFTPLQKSVFYV